MMLIVAALGLYEVTWSLRIVNGISFAISSSGEIKRARTESGKELPPFHILDLSWPAWPVSVNSDFKILSGTGALYSSSGKLLTPAPNPSPSFVATHVPHLFMATTDGISYRLVSVSNALKTKESNVRPLAYSSFYYKRTSARDAERTKWVKELQFGKTVLSLQDQQRIISDPLHFVFRDKSGTVSAVDLNGKTRVLRGTVTDLLGVLVQPKHTTVIRGKQNGWTVTVQGASGVSSRSLVVSGQRFRSLSTAASSHVMVATVVGHANTYFYIVDGFGKLSYGSLPVRIARSQWDVSGSKIYYVTTGGLVKRLSVTTK